MRWFLIPLLGCANFCSGKTYDEQHSETSFFAGIRSSKTFVDKTLWLKEFWELPSKHLFLTAPLRFGKTTNLKMMEEFFSITNDEKHARKIFDGTDIHAKEKDFFNAHFRKYPVVYINFGPLLGTTNRLTFREHVCTLFRDIRYYTDPTLFNLTAKEKISEAKNFSAACVDEFQLDKISIDYTKALHEHYHQKIIILIDEIDALTRATLKWDIVEHNKVVFDYGQVLKKLMEGNEHIEKTISVGSVYTDELAHVDPYPDCFKRVAFNEKEQYAKFFGLTDHEVEQLLGKFSLTGELPRFKSFYDGYLVANSSLRVYNTISPIKFVLKPKFKPYWAQSVEPLKNDFHGLFSRPEIGSLVEKALFRDLNDLPKFANLNHPVGKDMFHVINGNVDSRFDYVESKIDERDVAAAGDIFFKFLEESGYVKMITDDGFLATNQDAAYALGTALARDSDYYENARNISTVAKTNLVEAFKNLSLTEKAMEKLAEAIHSIFHPACSLVTKERVTFGGPIFTLLAYTEPEAFEAVLAPMYSGVHWKTPDLILVRNDSIAFVLGLKWRDGAREAVDAALASQYKNIFDKHLKGLKVKSKIFLGINLGTGCDVSISYGEEGMKGKELKDIAYPRDVAG